jgi:hypothetical protein
MQDKVVLRTSSFPAMHEAQGTIIKKNSLLARYKFVLSSFPVGPTGIVTRVTSLLSQSVCVFRQKYQTEKYLLHHKVMLQHSV